MGESVFDLPAYQTILNLSRLLVLTSMNEAEHQNIDESIAYLRHAINFSQKIKSESNNLLISHMVGLAIQFESLAWFNRLISKYKLEGEHYKSLRLALEDFLPYTEDAFSKAFEGDYRFFINLVELVLNKPLLNRWEDYKLGQSMWYLEKKVESGRISSKGNLYGWLVTLLPEFYLHKNRAFFRALQKTILYYQVRRTNTV